MEKFDYTKHFPKIANVANGEGSEHKVILSDQEYLLSVWLDNGTTIMEIPVMSIITLQLTDDFLGFSQTGKISYSTPNNSIESFFKKVGDKLGLDCKDEDGETYSKKEQFTFQGTGSEMIHIKFQRVPELTNKESKSDTKSDIIMHTYIITDVMDNGGALVDKGYLLKFEGIEKNILENYRIDNYACGNASRKVTTGFLKDLDVYPKDKETGWSDRLSYKADKTGEAIYHVMLESYDNWSTKMGLTHNLTGLLPNILANETVLNFDSSELVKETDAKRAILRSSTDGGVSTISQFDLQIDVDNQPRPFKFYTNSEGVRTQVKKTGSDFWDFGSEKSFLYTQFRSNINSWDVVSKFNTVHTAGIQTAATLDGVPNINKYDPCILRLNRASDENTMPQISYRPLVTYFQGLKLNNAKGGETLMGDSFINTFTFQSPESLTDKFTAIPSYLKQVLCEDSTVNDKPISEFFFDPAKPEDASMLFKSYASQYTKTSDAKPNGIDGEFGNIKEYLGQNYVKPIYEYDIVGRHQDTINVHNNGLKTVDNIILSTYNNPPTRSAGVAVGRNRGILAFIFMNDALTFRTSGRIGVEAGMFYYAKMDKHDPDDKVGNKLTGIYMCSRVVHNISPKGSSYNQDITGVKFYEKPDKNDLLALNNNPLPEGFPTTGLPTGLA